MRTVAAFDGGKLADTNSQPGGRICTPFGFDIVPVTCNQ